MTKVKSLSVCPKCTAELPERRKGPECPKCLFVIDSGPNDRFSGPAYISIQQAEAVVEIEQGPDGPGKTKEIIKLTEDLESWAKNCSDEDRMSAVDDALLMVRLLIHSNASVDCMREMTRMGKQIGSLSESIEEYVRVGGHINVARFPDPAESESDSRGPKET